MIELANVSYAYGEKRVLRELSLSLSPGTLTGIIGANGCGKTTLMRLLARLTPPESGSLSLNGRPYGSFGKKEFARRVAYFPQTRPIPDMTVAELAACGRFPYADLSFRLGDRDRAAVAAALDRTDMEQFSARSLRTLSGGERQRAYLAMLLAQDTPFLLLDEPTAHIDICHQFALMRLLRGLCAERKCVVAVLHELPLALGFCDRVIAMEAGRVAAEGTPAVLVENGTVDRLFGVTCRAVPTPEGSSAYLITPRG